MISAGTVPNQHTDEDFYVKSRNQVIYDKDCAPKGCTTTSTKTLSTTTTTPPPQIIPKRERASIMKIHCLIDSLVNLNKYSGPPDIRCINNFNPLLVFIEWLANIHQEC